MIGSWFWGILTVVCVIWYALVTCYVAVRGLKDIRTMLARLKGDTSPTPR